MCRLSTLALALDLFAWLLGSALVVWAIVGLPGLCPCHPLL